MILKTIKSYFAFICEIQILRLFFRPYSVALSRPQQWLIEQVIKIQKIARERVVFRLVDDLSCSESKTLMDERTVLQVISKTFGENQLGPVKQKCLTNQSGQAIIEYVLLLVIVVSLFYGLSKTFFEPLQRYGTGVFTNTIACAFEYGQLPAEIVSEDGCEARFEGGRLSNSSNSGQRNQSSSSKSSDSSKKGETSQSTAASTSSSSGESGGGRSTTLYSRGSAVQIGRPSGVEGRAITSNQSYAEESGTRIDISDSDYTGRRGRRPILKPISGELEAILLTQKSKKLGEINRSIASTVEGSERKTKKLIINAKKNTKAQDEVQKPWDFYFLLRIALIILMVAAILLFIFFQLAQIRRGSSS